MNDVLRYSTLAATALIALAMSGCAATETLLAKKDLVVQAKTSTAIFVDPVPRAKRTIYFDVRSGVDGFDRRAFKSFVAEQFTANEAGYRLVDDPGAAQFTMVAYVLNLEEVRPTAAEQALAKGYQGDGILGGAALGSLVSDSDKAVISGGLAGGVLEKVTSNLVHDVTFTLVCDVQIRERATPGVRVRKTTKVEARVSDRGSSRQQVSETTDRKEYRTRIVATANKANLELADAQAQLFRKTAQAMAGFF